MTVGEFITKWKDCSGSERSNYAIFLTELCGVLGVEAPGPRENYRIDAPVPGGAEAGGTGFIDLYKSGCFILEAKQSKVVCELPTLPTLIGQPPADGSSRYDELMRRAFRQARRYAQSLTEPPFPPFIIVLDVGRAFELYFDFAGNGRDYRFFPDRATYRIPIAALASPDKVANTDLTRLELLRAIWTDPRSLDPRLRTSKVTRDIAERLASVSKWMEETQRLKKPDAADWERSLRIEETSLFLMRVLFCMFAEDIGLFGNDPKMDRPFADFLRTTLAHDRQFEKQLQDLWLSMGQANRSDRWSHALGRDVAYFNGTLFLDTKVFVLAQSERGELLRAAEHDWQNVEPAIFGTLLEQALTPGERAKLGAHYTPRPYVERIVEATITDVLRPEWEELEASLEGLPKEAALERLRGFHDRLAQTRVLDPACGTGNFLYVAMEALLGLENKVIQAIEDLGGTVRSRIGPGQFHGLEKNPRAAKIAELVLWIGWLRWNIRNGAGEIGEPILGQRANINFGRPGGYDAVLAQDATGAPDLSHPRQPEWPEADFIVGNPPFIGKGSMLRAAVGDDYAEALWRANPSVPASADFVMQWWDRAARELTRPGARLRRFGFVTTNSITQAFSRRVIERYLAPSPSPQRGEGGAASAAEGEGERAPGSVEPQESSSSADPPHPSPLPPGEREQGLHLHLACPDHPWTKATRDAAAVRIAMTVAEAGPGEGTLLEVEHEAKLDSDTPDLQFAQVRDRINADLTIGADVTSATPLRGNAGLSCNGMMLAGQGFKVSRSIRDQLIASDGPEATHVIRPFLGGSELLHGSKGLFVIDFAGLAEAQARRLYPAAYQHLLQTVLPERASNRDAAFKAKWWLFGRVRPEIRAANAEISRFIATTETAKHRVFQFVSVEVVPDHMVIAIGSEDGFHLGVLSSRIHVHWSLRAGGTLEDRPRYNKANIFDPFPFPDPAPEQRSRIAALAEELDATRKAALAEVPRLTMTELYNLRERIAAGEALAGETQARATAARAYIVHQLHEEIDRAVAEAYGWPTDLAPSEIVARLVALNAARKAEEEAGHVRWLRPDYQAPRFGAKKKVDAGSGRA
ncbi:MAG TPA: DNA methyltransferase [Allosphingosinicella sp.]|nr:DNA methyltransferase [Allosphingosinicella sp.]